MNPKFSIIIPTYNRASFIKKAIHSVIAQTYGDWELIIIDDGSDDETKDVVFSIKDKRIMYGKQDNLGRSVARNTGLHHARGEWICFLDSDDWYIEDHLESFNKAINENLETAIFRTGVLFQDTHGKEVSRSKFHHTHHDQIPFILRNYSSVLDLCIRADIAKKVQFPNIVTWEDKAYMTVLLRHFPWHQIDLHTVVALEHGGRSIKFIHEDIPNINNTLKIMEQCLTDVNLRDRHLGPVQQHFLLSIMISASRVGLNADRIKDIFNKVDKPIMPMTWVRFWKTYLLDGSKM